MYILQREVIQTFPSLQRAYELSLAADIWRRPTGLIWVWGKLIEQVWKGIIVSPYADNPNMF